LGGLRDEYNEAWIRQKTVTAFAASTHLPFWSPTMYLDSARRTTNVGSTSCEEDLDSRAGFKSWIRELDSRTGFESWEMQELMDARAGGFISWWIQELDSMSWIQ